jgi:quinol monooxygenase YgiN
MTTLDPGDGGVALINTFRVKPGKAAELVAVLTEATETTMGKVPGFISANLHVSEDGTRVVNYAQWRSKADFEAMKADPRAREHMGAAAALSESFEPVLYELRYSHSA